jgi:hypothetical protein
MGRGGLPVPAGPIGALWGKEPPASRTFALASAPGTADDYQDTVDRAYVLRAPFKPHESPRHRRNG